MKGICEEDQGLYIPNPEMVVVLRWCNKIRREQHKKVETRLKKGYRNSPTACPIAKTIGGRVRVLGTKIKFKNGVEKRLPKYVTEFIRRFDGHSYPDLIEY